MEKKKSMTWMKDVNPEVLERMIPDKLKKDFYRPTHLEIFAQTAIVTSKRSTCLWNEVGAVIFYENHILSTGYNGPVVGDVDPRDVGCARVVGGELKQGQGFCRGSHAELNAIGMLTVSPMTLDKISMLVTLRPCLSCTKQIVNLGIKEVYYLWDYSHDKEVFDFFERTNVKLSKFESPFLSNWIKVNDYLPHALKNK